MRKNYMKFIGSFVIMMCMAAGIIFAATESKANDVDTGIYYAPNVTYEADNTAPAKPEEYSDYLFAGWYSNTGTEETPVYSPVKNPTINDTYYAKWVPAAVLGVKAQVSGSILNDELDVTADNAIRFVTSLDSTDYAKVAFTIDVGGYATIDTGLIENGTDEYVYTTIYAIGAKEDDTDVEQKKWEYSPAETFENNASTYFKTYTFTHVPEGYMNTDITVTPYWVTLDGTKVEGTTAIRTANYCRSWYYVDSTGAVTNSAAPVGTDSNPYTTLANAVAVETELNPKLILKSDVTSDSSISVNKSMTITTDGVADRTISCGITASLLTVDNADVTLTLKGSSEDSKLIFDGTDVTLTGSVVNVANATKLVMKYVTMQNLKGTTSGGNAIRSFALLNAEDCTFVNCELTGTNTKNGGAISLQGGAKGSTLTNCIFQNCKTTQYGGAIYATVEITVTEGTFTGCETTYVSKARGGAICVDNNQGTEETLIDTCTFTQNKAKTGGGAVAAVGKQTLTIKDSTFDKNETTKKFGGAVAFSSTGSTLNLEGKCIFHENVGNCDGANRGGALYAPPTINIDDDAWIEFCWNINQNVENPHGNAFGINASNVTDVKLTIGSGVSLYVFENYSAVDNKIDICINGGTEYDLSGRDCYRTSNPHTSE